MSAFLKAKKKGSAYYEIIIKTLVFITMIATAVSFFSIFTVYLNLNYTCRRVVREIEKCIRFVYGYAHDKEE